MIVPADCERCGACCSFDSPTFVPLNEEDVERLGTLDVIEMHEGRPHMGSRNGKCIALDETNGLSQCSIYDERPELCRDFHQGSSECRSVLLAARKQMVLLQPASRTARKAI